LHMGEQLTKPKLTRIKLHCGCTCMWSGVQSACT